MQDVVQELESCNPLINNVDFAFEICQAELKSALAALAGQTSAMLPKLEVVTGPSQLRGVFAKETIKSGAMQLPPLTNNIGKRKQSTSLPLTANRYAGFFTAGTWTFSGEACSFGLILSSLYVWLVCLKSEAYSIILSPKTVLPCKDEVTGQIEKKRQLPCIIPFWFVRSLTEEGKCNAKVETRNCEVMFWMREQYHQQWHQHQAAQQQQRQHQR